MDFQYVCENSVRIDKTITVDMLKEDFYPLNIFLNNQIEKAWVEQLKVENLSRLDLTRSSESSSSWPKTSDTRSITLF